MANAFVANLNSSGSIVWARLLGGAGYDNGIAIAVDSSNDVFVAGATTSLNFPTLNPLQPFSAPNGALLQSTDGGQTFQPTGWPSTAGSIDYNALDADQSTSPITLYAGAATGLWKSADGGASFSQPAQSGLSGAIFSLNFDPAIPALFVGTSAGLFKSTDGGNTFTQLTLPGSVGTHVYWVHYNALLALLFVGTNNGACFSSDGGSTFTAVTMPASGIQVFSGTFDDNSGTPYLGTDRGVFLSNDGGNTFVATNMNFNPVYSMAFDIPNGIAYAGTYSIGVVASTDGFNTNFTFAPIPRFFPIIWGLGVGASGTPEPVYFGVSSLGLNTIWNSTNGGTSVNLLDGANFDQSGVVTPLLVTSSAIYAGNFQDQDAFITELSSDGSTVLFSSFLGGTGFDYASSLALDGSGNAYVTGTTAAADFPVTSGSAQTTFGGFLNAFVAKVDFNSSTPIPRAITQVLPNDAGNSGTVTITLTMTGAEQGAVVELIGTGACSGTIEATSVNVSADGDTVTATFDLTNACVGSYNVEVLNPDGTSALLSSGFTVQASGSPNLWVSILGRSLIRVDQPSSVQITYGNSGNEDAYVVPLWIELDSTLTYTLQTSLLAPPEPPGVPALDFSTVPIAFNASGKTVLPILLPAVRAGTSGAVQLQITAPASGAYAVQAAIYPPWVSSPSDLSNLSSPGAANFNAAVAAMTSTWPGIEPSTTCQSVFPGDLANELNTEIQGLPAGYNDLAFGTLQYVIAAADNPQCGASWPPVNAGTVAITNVSDAYSAGSSSGPAFAALGTAVENVHGGSSFDPNFKRGPAGAGASRWISATAPITYSIAFTNEASATLPAQQVRVTDQLDLSALNLASFSFGPIAFGSHTLSPPVNVSQFIRDLDLRPAQSLIVRVQGNLDPGSGALSWTFSSIDPNTGQPPTDPTVGFLPPDTNPPEGEGNVTFTVMPNAADPNGTATSNQGTVVFDQNTPINTAAWPNTIAQTVPVKLRVLPAKIAFLNQKIGTASIPQRVQLTNPKPPTGHGQPVTIEGFTISGDFTLAKNTCLQTLKAGHSCFVAIDFSPTGPGHRKGTLFINSNAQNNPRDVALSGRNNQAVLSASASSLAFGTVSMESTKTRKLILTNTGSVAVSFLDLSTTGQDFSQTNNCGVKLAPTHSCTMRVTFAPTLAGTRQGTVVILDDTLVTPQKINLTGTGG